MPLTVNYKILNLCDDRTFQILFCEDVRLAKHIVVITHALSHKPHIFENLENTSLKLYE